MKEKKKPSALLVKTLNSKSKDSEPDHFKVSFKHLDTSQKYGSSFLDWQKSGLLAKMLEVLQGYCCSPLHAQLDGDKFTQYKNFPPKEKTNFKYPAHVPEDADWARIHINGIAVIAGHIVKDTFYVVFLDKTHKFWISNKRNT